MHTLRAACLSLLLGGCAAHLQVLTPTSETPGQALVRLLKAHDDLFDFEVINETQGFLLVDRDQVHMMTPDGLRARLPGGIAGSYSIPPGGLHRVKVKFDRHNLPSGCEVWITFDGALRVNGYPLKVPPVRFRVD
jgi:hypothetical protein